MGAFRVRLRLRLRSQAYFDYGPHVTRGGLGDLDVVAHDERPASSSNAARIARGP
jgi:hypothetical protein